MKKMAAKLTVLAVTTALVAGSALTGCGKKKVDYTLDDGQSGGDASGGSLAERLEIPETYKGTIDGIDSATGLMQVSIDDSDIEVPDSDKMSTVYFERKTYTNDDKKRICESYFDVNAGIYLYDTEHPYRPYVEASIEYWEGIASKATSDDDKAMYDEMVESAKSQLKDAVDTREGAGDYSGDIFVGTMGEKEYLLSFYETEDNDSGAGFSIIYNNNGSMLAYRPMDGATDAYCYSTEGNMTENITNTASITKDKAEQEALDFLLSCGITDVVCTGTYDIEWDYTDSTYAPVATEYCGYAVKFARSIDGAAPYVAYTWNVDGMYDGDSVYYGNQSERYELYVDDNGIFQVTCDDGNKATGDKDENVNVITWKEALEALPKAINTWYADGSSYSSINFNDVRLSYYLIPDGDKYKYEPVYVFAECEEYDNRIETQYPIHLIMLDAISGELVNLKDVLAGQGVTFDSTDAVVDDATVSEPETEIETSEDSAGEGDADVDSGDADSTDADSADADSGDSDAAPEAMTAAQ